MRSSSRFLAIGFGLCCLSVFHVSADVVFTSEKCESGSFGLQLVPGDPSRYRQCGPAGRVWVVPCAPGMSFDPESRVCKEPPSYRSSESHSRRMPPQVTTEMPVQEFVFSTRRPKRPRIKGKFRKTTTPVPTTIWTTTESSLWTDAVGEPYSPAFTPPNRFRNLPSTQSPPEETVQPQYTVQYNGETMTEAEFLRKLTDIVKEQKRAEAEKKRREEEEKQRIEQQQREEEVRREEEEQLRRQQEAERQRHEEQLRIQREREEAELRRREEQRQREREEIERRMREEQLQREREEAERKRQEEEERRRQEELQEQERQKAIELAEQERKKLERERKKLEAERLKLEAERKRQEEQRQAEQRKKEEQEARRKEEEAKKALELKSKQEQIEAEMARKTAERMEQERLERERQKLIKAAKEEEERKKKQELDRAEFIKNQLAQQKKEMEEAIANERKSSGAGVLRFPPGPGDAQQSTISPATPTPPHWNTDGSLVTDDYKQNKIETKVISEIFPESKVVTGCMVNGDCPFSYDYDLFCPHPSDPASYLHCSPMTGRRGRWTHRLCPPGLVFSTYGGRCEKDAASAYKPTERVVIPRLPSEPVTQDWRGNREMVTVTYRPDYGKSIKNTIDTFPTDLLPTFATPVPMTKKPVFGAMYPDDENDLDLTQIRPLFPRVQPGFLTNFLPFEPLREGEAPPDGNIVGSIVKPLIKKLALDHTKHFLDRMLADEKPIESEKDRLRTDAKSTGSTVVA